jgi:uncharacterized repeat protein (TIGR01451 family)
MVSPAASGTLTNTATVSAADATDTNPNNNSASDTDTITQQGDLSITKTDGVDTVAPGESPLIYTIVVSNSGPSRATNATVTDLFPPSFIVSNWTVVGTDGATSTQGSGTGNIADTVTLPPNSTLTYTVNGSVSGSASGTLVNTSTVAAPAGFTDTNPGNNSATDTDTIVVNPPVADLSITKTDGVTSVIPGTNVTYTIVVRNNSATTNVMGAQVGDTFPAILTNVTFTATQTGGASGFTASGTGSISDTVNLPAGSTITYTAHATVNPAAVGQLSNTATVTAPPGVEDPDQSNNTATDTNTLTPVADLAVAKVLTTGRPAPGNPASYTITVTNLGPSSVNRVILVDAIPPNLLNPVFSASNGSYDPVTHIWDFATPLAKGQSATLTLSGTIAPQATGTISNTATVSPPAGVTDPNLSNNTATTNDALFLPADLAVTKSANVGIAAPGSFVTYTIIVTNFGPGTVANLRLVDSPSPLLLNPTYGVSTGSYDPTTGLWTGLNLASGQSIMLMITEQLSPAASGAVSDTATVSLTPTSGASFDPNLSNNQATASVAVQVSKRSFITSRR